MEAQGRWTPLIVKCYLSILAMSHHFPKEDSPKPFSSELPASLRKIAERETHVFVSGMNFKTYQLQQGFIWSVICPGWRKFKVPIATHVALSQDKVGAEGSKLSSSAGWNLCLWESWGAQDNRKLKTPQRMGHPPSVKVLAIPTQSHLTHLGLKSLQRGYLWTQGNTVWLLTCKWPYYMQMILFTLWKWA